MGIVFCLLFASVLIGLAAGLFFGGILAVELTTVLIAFAAAFILQSCGFEFVGGAIAIVGALLLNQIAFFAGTLLRPRFSDKLAYGLMGKTSDNEPRQRRDQPVNDNKPERDENQPTPPPPPGQ